MKLEVYENFGKYFGYLSRKGRSFITKELEKYGIGAGQTIFLITLYEKDGINQEQLAEELFMDKTTVARGLQKLEQNGIIRRVSAKNDKRSKLVFLTEKGRELESEVKNVLKTWDEKISHSLDDNEIENLQKILKKLYDSSLI
jgi:DNA-binding MarR family transcriptional regulator